MPTLIDLGINLGSIIDPNTRDAITQLFNLVEKLASENDKLRLENQALRDENARLKGEQGKPNIRGRNRTDISSEKERKTRPKDQPGSHKSKQLEITRTEVVPIDKATLPADAVSKGYETSIVQDLVITTDVIELKRETYYSPSLKRTFTADVPAGYEGGFGPRMKAVAILLKTMGNMTESPITKVFESFGVAISKSSVDRLLLKDKQSFHDEKQAIFTAGLASTSYQHIDDTAARVKGENWHNHVICNPYYSAFFTRERKDRLTVLTILSQVDSREELPYIWNTQANDILQTMGWPNKHDRLLELLPRGRPLAYGELTLFASEQSLSKTYTARLMEAMALAAYRERTDIPIPSIFMADDAPQFKLLTELLVLCWIHDGRHYKKLRPVIATHREMLNTFLNRYWSFYHELLDYKADPGPQRAEVLSGRFNTLFTAVTGYDQLDERIAKTLAKKHELLLVLTHPELPLHNNPAELGARAQVRKRDVSLHTMTDEGTKVVDTFLTITETAKKLGVNLYDYLLDRITGAYQMPSLADVIRERSGQVLVTV
ncbi:MAG: transposase [Chloroflexota bacterium]